ncbi:MAG: type II secretion system F family protein [Jatrophihabitans sp.]|uniref:type II secretion system F family protein n=1 Tax=Jatrophihabitans sp. TaxID=1932789 RepID=UPI003F81DDA7
MADAVLASPRARRRVVAATGVVSSVALGALGVAATAVGGMVLTLAGDRVAQRRDERRRRDELAAVRLLAAELAAGASLGVALDAAGEVDAGRRELWSAAAARARAGDDVAEVLLAAGGPTVAAVGHAIRVAAATGAPLAAVLGRIAVGLTLAEQRRAAVATAVAAPRASALLLAGLPVLGLGLGAAMGARPWVFLVHGGAGRLVCCAGVLLDVAGVLWMRRVLRRAVR